MFYNISNALPFLSELHEGIKKNLPETDINSHIFLPNNKLCSKFKKLISQNKVTILPKILPLHNIDEIISRYYPIPKKPNKFSSIAKIFTATNNLNLAYNIYEIFAEIEREKTDLTKISQIIPEQLANHQQKYLAIITESWSLFNGENISFHGYYNQMVDLYLRYLREYYQDEVIIAAGSTASIAATAKLLKAISKLKNGYVILPGYQHLDFTIDESHPQYNLHQLVGDDEVKNWHNDKPANLSKDLFLPTEIAITRWSIKQNYGNNIKLLKAKNHHQELNFIAHILYEAAHEKKSAAIILEDAKFAHILAQKISAYGIDIEKSVNYLTLESAKFLILLIDYILEPSNFALINIAKYCNITNINQYEIALRNKQDFADEEIASFQQSCKLFASKIFDLKNFSEILKYHLNFAEKIHPNLWQDNDLIEFIAEISRQEYPDFYLNLSQYRDFLIYLFKSNNFSSNYNSDIAILSPQDARLSDYDLYIIPAFYDKSYPPIKHANMFFNEMVRSKLGLSSSAKQIGISAHDFAEFIEKKEVILTHNSEEIESRWLTRLKLIYNLYQDDYYHKIDKILDAPPSKLEREEIAPRPPVKFRPKKLSASNIEKLIYDPYSIYAEKILRLKPLDPIDPTPGAKDFGILLHKIMEEIAKIEDLTQIAQIIQNQIDEDHYIHKIWRNKLIDLIPIIKQFERDKRRYNSKIFVEIHGEIDFADIKLIAKADRLELKDDNIEIIDFKTGKIASKKEILSMISPQLLVEAIISKYNGFKRVNGDTKMVSLVKFIAEKNQIEELKICLDNDIITQAEQYLAELFRLFQDPSTPYYCEPNRDKPNEYSQYRHLSRVLEIRV